MTRGFSPTDQRTWLEGILHWIVYMLECADKTLYTGITKNLDRRLAEHAAGKGARYTKGRGPFRLVYRETCVGRAEASRREAAIKSLGRAKKRQLFS
jgi:putative endonuclease